jgi:hypothetical protein
LPQCLLGFQYVALVDPATSKEAVAHHILAKQKNDHYQKDQKEEPAIPSQGEFRSTGPVTL